MSEQQQPDAPSVTAISGAQVPTQVEENSPIPVPPRNLNSSRELRRKTFKPLPPARPEPPGEKNAEPPEEPPAPSVQVLNPTIRPEDVRVTLSIKLETRTKIIHERDGAADSYCFLIPRGNVDPQALISFSDFMMTALSSAKKDYELYLESQKPKITDTTQTPLLGSDFTEESPTLDVGGMPTPTLPVNEPS